MESKARRVMEEALTLSEKERAELAARLLESLDEESDPDAERAWAAEITKRAERVRAGDYIAIDADVVDAELRRIIERK